MNNRCPASFSCDYHHARKIYHIPGSELLVTCKICGHDQVLDRYYTLPPHTRDGVVLLEVSTKGGAE